MASELDTSNTGVLYDLSQDLPQGATRHYYQGGDDDAATAKIMVDAPGADRRLILTHVSMNAVLDNTIIIQNGASTLVGPVAFEADGNGVWQKDFKWGLKLTANAAMNLKCNADTQVHIYLEYINAPV